MVDFPTGDPDIPTAALTGETLGTMHAGAGHPAATNRLITNIKALAAKLGYGASTPGASAGVLRRNGTGTSVWGQVQGGDVANGQVAPAHLVGPGAASANTVLRTTDGTDALFGKLLTADITAGAISQVWQASPSSSSPAIGATGLVTIPQMSLTITPQGGPILFLFYGTFFGSVVGTTLIVSPATNAGGSPGGGIQTIISNVNYHFGINYVNLWQPPAGTYIVEMQWSMSASGGAVAYSTWRQLTLVELKR